jgi:cytochrome c-type biogenesis protein CcsB
MRSRSLVMLLACVLVAAPLALPAQDAADQAQAGAGSQGHDHAQGAAPHPTVRPVDITRISEATLADAGRLIVQDYQGRMKPLDTLAREMVRKITKKERFEGQEPLAVYLGWLVSPQSWWERPFLYVHHPGLKDLLGVDHDTGYVSPASLVDERGSYRLSDDVEEALRTPDRDRTKTLRKLLSFDERFNLFYMTLQGRTLKLFPLPDDPNHTWYGGREILEELEGDPRQERFQSAFAGLLDGLRQGDERVFADGVAAVRALQEEYGAGVLPGGTALGAEILLNRVDPFLKVLGPYFGAFVLLIFAYFWSLFRRGRARYSWRHPLYLVGMIVYIGSFALHLGGFILRWIAAGFQPLSNGYESLIYISLTVALAGLIFELVSRRGVAAGLASLLTFEVIGVSMASHFDPAIGLLVPVLDSYWLNIHVTVIVASYGFLGLGALLGALILILHFWKSPRREHVATDILSLDRLLYHILVAGLALLTIGTILGGVWANESWGRYWGWDPKETWSLVTILVYAAVLHFRWVPALNRPWVLAAGAFAGVASVIMTYFGVNYFLAGLHSYAQGDAAQVPGWVYIGAGIMTALIVASGIVEFTRGSRVPTVRNGVGV